MCLFGQSWQSHKVKTVNKIPKISDYFLKQVLYYWENACGSFTCLILIPMLIMQKPYGPVIVPVFIQWFKTTSLMMFSTFFKPINHVQETRFRKHIFKQPEAFSKHVNLSASYWSPKLLNSDLITAEK